MGISQGIETVLPLKDLSNRRVYVASIHGSSLFSNRDGNLSPEIKRLKALLETHLFTPNLLEIRAQEANLIQLRDRGEEFFLEALGFVDREELKITIVYPKKYSGLDKKTLEKYGLTKVIY